jgi:hypothetical protein
MKRLVLIFSVMLLAISACTPKPPDPVVPPEIETSEIILPSETPEPSQTPEPTVEPEGFTKYRFEMRLDYHQKTAEIAQTIDYLNKSDFNLLTIQLVIPPRAYTSAYTQNSLAGDLVSGFSEDGIRTNIQLSQALQPGQRTSINLTYQLTIPQRDGSFGWTERQVNLNNWYPYIPPLAEDGSWLSYEPVLDQQANSLVGEYIVNEISDFELDLYMVENLNVLVASGANATPIEGGMHYSLEKARGLAFSFSNQFHHEQVQQDGTMLNAYVFQYQKDKAQAILEIAGKAMTLFTQLYGPYQRQQLTIVAWDFSHSMEMDGMLLMSGNVINFYDNTAENNLTILIPHELSHQWFYSQVGNNQAMEPWLDEALATYSEALYYENYHPELSQWWWDNRVYAHGEGGYVNNSIYDAKTYEVYRNSVYLNGAVFLHELRIAMGDSAFFSALKNYVALNDGKIATKADFFNTFQSANPSADISSVFNRYFKN